MNHPHLRLLCTLLPLLVAGCDEALPPKNDPLAVVRADFKMYPGVVNIRDSVATGIEGVFEGSVVNTFSEVLQDSQRVLMVVDVSWKPTSPTDTVGLARREGDSSQTTRITADRNNVLEPQYLNGEILTLQPGKPLHIFTQWSHRTDKGVWYWSFAHLNGPFVGPDGMPYRVSDPVILVVTATVQGFRRVGGIRLGPFEYRVRYRIY